MTRKKKSGFPTVLLVWLLSVSRSVWEQPWSVWSFVPESFAVKVRDGTRRGKKDESNTPSWTFPHIRIQATRQRLVEILNHTDRAAIGDRSLTRWLKAIFDFTFCSESLLQSRNEAASLSWRSHLNWVSPGCFLTYLPRWFVMNLFPKRITTCALIIFTTRGVWIPNRDFLYCLDFSAKLKVGFDFSRQWVHHRWFKTLPSPRKDWTQRFRFTWPVGVIAPQICLLVAMALFLMSLLGGCNCNN